MPHKVPQEMSKEDLKKWLFDNMDSNKDGRISMKELHRALKELGHSFGWLKTFRAFWFSDTNWNGAIDTDSEIDKLITYAQNMWGIKVTN
ncbi:EF-hand-containing protein [Dioscorea alata]|uniref:EF-hand-containing protein n=1 Tax=Dioscorea alata TaxID=55571 RepID=A0ACB7TXQ0_DIOAL|nr:EF-hand-containing protein [Dioscorea alata]